uniref:Uncharacterized protein n=1 Tax=Romanomermis culicivorax TaxID=13658 RepID=A0A915HZU2_ROMCU
MVQKTRPTGEIQSSLIIEDGRDEGERLTNLSFDTHFSPFRTSRSQDRVFKIFRLVLFLPYFGFKFLGAHAAEWCCSVFPPIFIIFVKPRMRPAGAKWREQGGPSTVVLL